MHAHDFQISIHIEHGYHLHKTEVVTLLKQRLDAMHVNLCSEVITLVSVMIHHVYQKWLGFAKPRNRRYRLAQR